MPELAPPTTLIAPPGFPPVSVALALAPGAAVPSAAPVPQSAHSFCLSSSHSDILNSSNETSDPDSGVQSFATITPDESMFIRSAAVPPLGKYVHTINSRLADGLYPLGSVQIVGLLPEE